MLKFIRQYWNFNKDRKRRKLAKKRAMSTVSCMPQEDSSEGYNNGNQVSTYERCDNGTWENNSHSQGPIPPDTVPYYYEDISRETADLILWDRGCIDGMYLLRKSTNRDADFVLSLCFNNSVLHYRLKTFPDGLVGLTGMPRQKFAGPVELINKVEGVACKPRIPCCRIASQFSGDLYFGMTKEEVRKIMKQKAQEWDIQDDKLDSQRNENYGDLKSLMLKTVHEYQPWFHGNLSREEAENRMDTCGHQDGKFLVRERDDCSYALCVSVGGVAKHYKIDVLPSGEFAIQASQKFPNLMVLIRHYMVCNDGLKVVLKLPCSKSDGSGQASAIGDSSTGTNAKPSDKSHDHEEKNVKLMNIYSNQTDISAGGGWKLKEPEKPRKISLPDTRKVRSSIRTEVDSRRRLSSPPEAVGNELGSPLSTKNLIDELQNLSVKIPGNGGDSNACSPPVPAPRLSLNTRSRSVDGDLQANSDAPLPDPPEGVSSSFGGFFYKLFGRVQKAIPTNDQPVTYDNVTLSDAHEVSAKKTPVSSPMHKPIDSFTKISNVASKKQTTAHQPFKSDRPQPLPRKRGILDLKVTSNSKSEDSNQKLISIQEDSGNGDENQRPGDDDTPQKDSLSQKSASSSDTPINEPLYVEIDPTIEEESVDGSQTVNWETNVDYEPMSTSPQAKNSSLSRSASAPSQQPLIKQSSSGDEKSTSSQGGVKPKNFVEQERNKSSRSKSISPRSKNICSDIGETGWDDEPRTPPPVPVGVKLKRRWSKEKSESIYRTIRRYRKNYINLDRKAIKIEEKIGSGNFGDVMRATYSSSNGDMDLAIKTLKPNSLSKQKNEILKEARTMARFDHCHIVRLIGVCEGDPFMLLMELAPLGPLNKYLKKNRDVQIDDIIMLIEQVAMAMEYLESKQYVHRDLAARNVLLVNDKFVKISDFGMSRALGIGRDYYRAAESGKWPLKWYAPECIYYFKFSSKSDVWSFGVTLWEALSYGEKPYQGMVGKEILELFHRNERLAKPRGCPDVMYEVMWKCWQMKPEDRPYFSELRQTLHNFTSS